MEDIKLNIENECPICFEDIEVAVACKNDHLFCNKCYHKMLRKFDEINCPLCRIKITPKSSKKAIVRSIIDEKKLSDNSKISNYKKLFYTGYAVMMRYDQNISQYEIKALRDIVYSLFENCEDEKFEILKSLKYEIPIFIIEQFLNKYNIEFPEMYSIIIDALVRGNRNSSIIFLIKKYPQIAFEHVYIYDFAVRKNLLQFAIECNSDYSILELILEINPELILVKEKSVTIYKLAKSYAYDKKIIKKLRKKYFTAFREKIIGSRINIIKEKLDIFRIKYL